MIPLVFEVYGAFCFFSLIAFLVWASVAKSRPDLDEAEFEELEKLKKLAGCEQSDSNPQLGDLTHEDQPRRSRTAKSNADVAAACSKAISLCS